MLVMLTKPTTAGIRHCTSLSSDSHI
jgi:hypothetical protein